MKAFLLNIMLSLAWAALLGQFSVTNLLAGFALGYIMLWVMQDVMHYSSYFVKVGQVISFIRLFLWELLLSNLRVAYSVVTPLDKMRPGIIAVPLDVDTDVGITMLANMITLTPGTLSLDVSEDRRTLYVHSMHVHDIEAFRRSIKDGFERKVLEVLK